MVIKKLLMGGLCQTSPIRFRRVSRRSDRQDVILPSDVCEPDLLSRSGMLFLLAKSNKKHRGRRSVLMMLFKSCSDIGKVLVPAKSCTGDHFWYISRRRPVGILYPTSSGCLKSASSFNQSESSAVSNRSFRTTGCVLLCLTLARLYA